MDINNSPTPFLPPSLPYATTAACECLQVPTPRRQEQLADLHEAATPATEEPAEERNKWVVLALYEALNSRDVATVQRLLNPDLEWWFHGPPAHQHMMRVLTGRTNDSTFVFRPTSIAAFGDVVLVEGSKSDENENETTSPLIFWVHAWTVGADGIITQVREYFNTSLTVTRLCPVDPPRSPSSCVPLWQSKLSPGASVPSLVLAL